MYNEVNITNQLSRNPCIRFFNKRIEILKDQNTVGNKTWGKLDYLVKLGYSIDRVDKFTDNYTYEEKENLKNKKFKQWKKEKK